MLPFALRALLLAACLCAMAPAPPAAAVDLGADPGAGLPRLLQGTGLYAADGRVRADAAEFTPQFALWSDGADKRRWLWLPPGRFIDGSRPDAWAFPRGTRLWKEFSHDGRPVETRYVEHGEDGVWRFGTYVWNEAGTEAELAPLRGMRALPVRGAPDGRYAVPARGDCLACHMSAPVPVLGASALQLSAARDPQAPASQPTGAPRLDLRALVARGWLRGLPERLLDEPPRLAAATPLERATLGYLHANCAHCHNTGATRVPLDLTLAQRAADPLAAREEVLRSVVNAASRYLPPDAPDEAPIVAPGAPGRSLLALRMQSRDARMQMPPLGTRIPDPAGMALVHRWITHDLTHPKEPTP